MPDFPHRYHHHFAVQTTQTSLPIGRYWTSEGFPNTNKVPQRGLEHIRWLEAETLFDAWCQEYLAISLQVIV